MSWYAKAEGYVTVKEKSDLDKVKELLKPYFDEEITVEDNNLYVVEDRNYNEDLLQEVYSNITPYIEKGFIEFIGEDNTMWLHSFEEGGKWEESPGYIHYDEDNKRVFVNDEKQAEEPDMER